MQERYKYLSSKTALQEKLLKRTPKKDTYKEPTYTEPWPIGKRECYKNQDFDVSENFL